MGLSFFLNFYLFFFMCTSYPAFEESSRHKHRKSHLLLFQLVPLADGTCFNRAASDGATSATNDPQKPAAAASAEICLHFFFFSRGLVFISLLFRRFSYSCKQKGKERKGRKRPLFLILLPVLPEGKGDSVNIWLRRNIATHASCSYNAKLITGFSYS